jgi:hypothetical protein
MRGIFRFLEIFMLWGLAFKFLSWFISGLFGKNWIYFWIYLIIAILCRWAYLDPDIRFNNNMPQFTGKPGYEILKEKLQDSDF